MTAKNYRIEIIIVDVGPLISLARADALELLLIFKDEVRLVITDFVEFEVTRNRDKHTDAQCICDFLTRYAGCVEIQETSIGKTMKQMFQMRQLYEENEIFRQMMQSNNSEPPAIPKDIGELSIVSFANELIVNPPGVPVLILAEDDFFLHSGAAVPGNAHILSTSAFLETLYELGLIQTTCGSAKAVDMICLSHDISGERSLNPIRMCWKALLNNLNLPQILV